MFVPRARPDVVVRVTNGGGGSRPRQVPVSRCIDRAPLAAGSDLAAGRTRRTAAHRRVWPLWLCLALLAACRMPLVQAAPEVPAPAPPRPELSMLSVGGGTMYPSFVPGVHHYAARCGAADDDSVPRAVSVTAQARRPGTRLTLLRADPAANAAATGRLAAEVPVAAGHDIALEASNGAGAATYVVHCLPADLPDIRIVTRRPGVSDGLIDRSSGSGAIEWQLGGTEPPRSATTEYLEIVDDPVGEICAPHQPTRTAAGTLVLFDNGNLCHGARKNEPPFTRVVEYDVSDGARAVFKREYRRPAGQGYSNQAGGVTVLDNGHWLITWGRTVGATVPAEELVTVSEVDPATGIALFEMTNALTYRVYRERESDVRLPLRLP